MSILTREVQSVKSYPAAAQYWAVLEDGSEMEISRKEYYKLLLSADGGTEPRESELWAVDAQHAYWLAITASENGKTDEAMIEAQIATAAATIGLLQERIVGG